VPGQNRAASSFVAAGSGEAREGGLTYEGRIIRRGDQSPKAMREKARFVLGAMELRMAAFGFGWASGAPQSCRCSSANSPREMTASFGPT
jgi:hypothetical protein